MDIRLHHDYDVVRIACLFDGEGCVHFRRHGTQWANQLTICNTVKAPLDLAKEIFGGSVCGSRKKGSNYIVWQWTVTGVKAEKAAQRLEPHCLIKREQLRVFLEARTTFRPDGSAPRLSAEYREKREACAAKLSMLRLPAQMAIPR